MSDHWFTDEQLEAAAKAVAKLRIVPGSHLTTIPDVGDFEMGVARAALLAASPQWRPIESAPKDGRHVLVGFWSPYEGEEAAFAQSVARWSGNINDVGDEGWTDGTVGSWGYEEYAILQPTHYMPLPLAPRPATPPVAGAEGGDTKPLPVSSPEREAK